MTARHPRPASSPRSLSDLPAQFGPAKVKLGIRNTTDIKLASIIRASIYQMQDNPNFPDPLPSQDIMQQALTAFAQTIIDADSARSAAMAITAKKAGLRATLEKLYAMRGNYLDMVSGGDPLMILDGGLQVRSTPSPIGELDMPTGLVCELNGTAGFMLLSWNPVTNAQTYLVQMASITSGMSPSDYPWVTQKPCPKRKLTVKNLLLGQSYAYRIVAVGGKTGQGPWSPPVMRTAG